MSQFYCPLLRCLNTEPHEHVVCEDCGAVAWGNATCKVCRSHWPGGDPLPRWRKETKQ